MIRHVDTLVSYNHRKHVYYSNYLIIQKKPSIQNDLQRKKERERIQKEIEKLKDSIQTLTKA